MLKLEKSSRLSGITVRLREREGFFEPRLLKALALALFLHVGGLALFQVTPFSFTSSYIFPPVKVQSDHLSHSISAVASSNPEWVDEELAPPSFSLVPPLEIAYLPPESTLLPAVAFDPHAFRPLEEHLWPAWDSPLTLELEEPRIRLSISGELAKHSLAATDPLLNQMQSIHKTSTPVYAAYSVQMDETTGELFWVERVQSSGIREIDQLTEKILFNLRFTPDQSREQVIGNIHFVVLN